jgi:hypothetical protein
MLCKFEDEPLAGEPHTPVRAASAAARWRWIIADQGLLMVLVMTARQAGRRRNHLEAAHPRHVDRISRDCVVTRRSASPDRRFRPNPAEDFRQSYLVDRA